MGRCPEPRESLDGTKRRGLGFRKRAVADTGTEPGTSPGSPQPGPPRDRGRALRPRAEVAMAKQRYYLDTRVLTAFFFAAMPFVAFGSFIVVNQARNQLRESVGASLEQRAAQTKLALEQYVGEQVAQLRILALDPEVQKALLAPLRPVPPAEARQMEQAWVAGRDAKLNASLLETPLAEVLKPLA